MLIPRTGAAPVKKKKAKMKKEKKKKQGRVLKSTVSIVVYQLYHKSNDTRTVRVYLLEVNLKMIPTTFLSLCVM